jgi:hypothetical protein
MLRYLLPAIALLLLLVPCAEAACGVPFSRAVYETPSVQVYATKKHKLVACYRATGKAQVVGERFNDGMGTDESDYVAGVLGGRWLHKVFYATAAESPDVRLDSLIDLRDDDSATAPVLDSETDNDVAALAGAIVTAGADGVVARFTDGRYEVLSTQPAAALAATGARVYWHEGAEVRTAALALPAPDPARPLPRARTIGRCKPRPGARLLVHDRRIVLTRAGGATWACRSGRTRRVGATADVSIGSDREVAYTRPGYSGVLDVANGKRRELESAGGPVVLFGGVLAAAGPTGVRAWILGRPAAEFVSAEPATDVAVGYGLNEAFTYWIDAGGNARSRAIT